MLWSGDLSLSSLSEPLVLGSEDSRIAGVTPALGWGVAGGVRLGSSSGLSSSSAPALLRYCRNVRPTWVKFDSKDTKESE